MRPAHSVGEAQLPLVAQGSGFRTGHPPPDAAAEMGLPSCRLLPGLLEPQGSWGGWWAAGEGCPTQGREHILRTRGGLGAVLGLVGVLVGDPAMGSSHHLEGRFPGGYAALLPVGPPGMSGRDTGAPCASLGFPVACRRAWQQPVAVAMGRGCRLPAHRRKLARHEGTLREGSCFPRHAPALGRGSPGRLARIWGAASWSPGSLLQDDGQQCPESG